MDSAWNALGLRNIWSPLGCVSRWAEGGGPGVSRWTKGGGPGFSRWTEGGGPGVSRWTEGGGPGFSRSKWRSRGLQVDLEGMGSSDLGVSSGQLGAFSGGHFEDAQPFVELGAGVLGHVLLDLIPDGHLQDLEIELHVKDPMLHTGKPSSHPRSIFLRFSACVAPRPWPS